MNKRPQEKLWVAVPAFIYAPIALMLVLTLFTVGAAV